VSNIERKPVTRDEDADLTQSLEESRKESAGVTATDKSEGVETPQPVSSPKHSTPAPKETLDEQNDDDTNLFEESLLLVDRNDMGAEVQPVNTNEGIPVLHPSGTEPVEVEQFIAHAKGVAEGILSNPTASPAKSKSKRKLAQPRKDPNKPIVIVLDSLGQPHSGAARALKSWITAEGDARRAINATIKENAYYPKGAQIPTQENFTDCGVYLLGYVEKFFQDPDSFKNKLLTGAMSSEEDWPELKPKEMRAKMRDIIFKCHKEQEENRKAEKKIKKGVMSVKTPSRPVSREPAKADSNAPLTGQPPSEESKVQRSKVEDTQDQHLSTAQRIGETARPRLASPINFTQRPAESSDHSPPVVISKVSDSPPVATSPSRPPSVAPRTNRTPRRVSPEVRILVKTPMSSSSIRSGQNIPIGGSPKNEDRHDIGKAPSSVTPKKRPRQDENDGQFASPATKRQSTRSPRQQGVNHSTNPLARGSSSNEPIEIGDSQDGASMVSQDLKHPQAKSVAQRQPPSRSIRPNPSFCPLSSSEEIQPPSAEKRRQQQSEESFLGRELEASLEQDAMMRSEAQQEEARSPQIEILRSQPILRHIQEADHDPMDLDSQPADLMDVNKLALDSNSTIEMEMDDANDTVIRETPELESKSPNSQMLV
jgi:sentrin-specific protease 7